MSLTNALHDLLEGTGVGEMNLLIFAATIGVVVSALIHKPLTMRTRVVLVTLSALTFGTAFVVEDQIRISERFGLLLISTVIGTAAVVLLCTVIAIFVIKLAGKNERMTVIMAAAIVIMAALSIAAYAVYLNQPVGAEMRAVAYYSWLYTRDLSALCVVPFAAACLVNAYRQSRRTAATVEANTNETVAEPVNLAGSSAKWQKPGT